MDQVRRLFGDLPDARARSTRGEIRTPLGRAVPVFCVNCGAEGGFAYVETAAIFYLCPACEEQHGRLDLPTVDEEVVRGTERRR